MSNKEFFVIQNKSRPNIYYKEKRHSWKRGYGYPISLIEVSDIKAAKKYKAISEIHASLDKTFGVTLKAQIADISGGLNILRCVETIVFTQEELVDNETVALVNEMEHVSQLIKDTHYSTIELYSRLRKDPKLTNYKYILSTSYDSMNTSSLYDLFVEHGLEPIKHKGNFAFNREEYWTAAKLICDKPFKSFNLSV